VVVVDGVSSHRGGFGATVRGGGYQSKCTPRIFSTASTGVLGVHLCTPRSCLSLLVGLRQQASQRCFGLLMQTESHWCTLRMMRQDFTSSPFLRQFMCWTVLSILASLRNITRHGPFPCIQFCCGNHVCTLFLPLNSHPCHYHTRLSRFPTSHHAF